MGNEGDALPFSIFDSKLSEQLAASARAFNVIPRVWRASRNLIPNRAGLTACSRGSLKISVINPGPPSFFTSGLKAGSLLRYHSGWMALIDTIYHQTFMSIKMLEFYAGSIFDRHVGSSAVRIQLPPAHFCILMQLP
ncbi:hypothetical protein [Rhizobium skierniewicense]|uniref:hypothetical protein n=1 Tax=Rhizobium skierniewicense TaxID=984260 RepID=UPI001F361B61|nr:hypothetical protein [Rhizobium skierniewicense]